jgi:oxaloacetate decarboxylase beta subunit
VNDIDLSTLAAGLLALDWRSLVMMAVGGLLIYLAIVKEYEPVLLLPIGIGCIIGNLPLSAMIDPAEHGMLAVIKQAGIDNELSRC